MSRLLWVAVAAAGLLTTLAACDSAASSGSTHVTLRLTDEPFPFSLADSANVTITRVEMVGADTADADARVVLYDGAPFAVNLLDLRNGIDTTMASLSVPEGDYRQLRFIVAEDARVVFADGRSFNLRVPSGSQTGIKVNLPAGALAAGPDSLDVLVDFNVEQSFVTRGNPASANFQGFTFKPVLKLKTMDVDGTPVATDSTES